MKLGYNFQVEILGAPGAFGVGVKKGGVKDNFWICGFANWVDGGAIH